MFPVEGPEFRCEFGGDLFVRVQMELPRMTDRKVVYRPISLSRIIGEWMLDDVNRVTAKNVESRIDAKGIDHMNVVRERHDRFNRTRDGQLGIVRQYDRREPHPSPESVLVHAITGNGFLQTPLTRWAVR